MVTQSTFKDNTVSLLKIQFMYTYIVVIVISMIYVMFKRWKVFAYAKIVKKNLHRTRLVPNLFVND